MADHPPPRSTGAGERATLMALFQYQRESVLAKLDGISDAEARTSPVPTGTSLLWLIKHLSMAETIWVIHRFAGRTEVPLPANELADDDTVDSVAAGYRATWSVVDEIVAGASFDDECAAIGNASMVDLRWVMMHLLEETARHAGHADILRELIDGSAGR